MQNLQAQGATAEVVKGRELAKGNAGQQTRVRTPCRAALSRALDRGRQAAKEQAKRVTALWHHVYTLDRLREAYYGLNHDAAPGGDGQTWAAYGEQLDTNRRELSDRLKRGAYQAPPVERVYIPKAEGRQRPIGKPTLEDKIVQRATVEVRNAIYEQELLGFAYGARPGRSPHHALDAVTVGIEQRHSNWVRDADMRGLYDAMAHEWLVKFIEHRIGEQRVVRHIRKWLKAGMLEDGHGRQQEEGRPKRGAQVHSWRTFICTLSLPSGRRSGVAGTHGELSSSCATVTTSASASSTKTPPSSFCATCGNAFRGSTWNCTLTRHASVSLGVGQATGARGGARGNRRPSTFSA
jgi:hypothetical protein